jgi:hypothetical protein
LALLHLDLGDIVIKHPSPEHAEPAFLSIDEHGVWQRFPHWFVPFVVKTAKKFSILAILPANHARPPVRMAIDESLAADILSAISMHPSD